MFVITELTRLRSISQYYAYSVSAFVVAYKFYYALGNTEIATFWSTTFGVITALKERQSITGVVYANNINYGKKNTLNECISDPESFFWDANEQVLYIHLGNLHNINYIDANFDYGVSIGLTNDKVRYLDNRPFYPYLKEYPIVTTEVDKFNYDQLAFIVDKLIFINKSGYFNQFKDVPLYGNKVSIKTGNDGDTYNDLIERATYYIDDYDFSADEFIVDIQDIRKTLTAQIPNVLLNQTDYPYLSDSDIGKVLPFGYGPLKDVPGLLINEDEISASIYPKFLFLQIITGTTLADITVYIKDNNDVWVEQTTGISVDWGTGIVTVQGARTLSSGKYSAYPIKATLTGIPNVYASDILKDLNERFLGLSYDSSNYDIAIWELNETYLSPISLYMDETKDIYEWIKEIQSLSSVGFRYTNTADNKRVILIDNPNRPVDAFIPQIRIKNIAKVVAQSNKDDLYNQINIGYNKSILNDTADKVQNADYYDISFDEYRITKIYTKDSGLLTEAEAIDRAAIQAEDYYKIRKIFECEVIGEEYLDLELYNIVELELTLTKKQFIYLTVIQEVLASPDAISETLLGITLQEMISSIEVKQVGDEYFGVVRGQIVSKAPNYSLKTNTIKVRQRPYSIIWENIYG